MHALHATKLMLVRTVSVLVFVCILTATASAYTIVMRGGRRVEIPAHFVVTAATLTYEVSPGFQVTINFAAIDVRETEKANNEVPGSFLKRIQGTATAPSADLQAKSSSRRTITNSDLGPSRRRRQESELAYEQRRKELGLPSVEESRRQTAAESALITSELRQARASEKESESYWRGRAQEFRNEIATLDAQLTYVRRQLDDPLLDGISRSYPNAGALVPFVSFGGVNRGPFRRPGIRPPVFGAPRIGAFYDPTYGGYDYSYERSMLIQRFNELAASRVGLQARLREFEDEARRAGAQPGWLRK